MSSKMPVVKKGDLWVDRDPRSPFNVEVLSIVGTPPDAYVKIRRFSRRTRVRYDRFVKRFRFLHNLRWNITPEDTSRE